MPNKLHSTFLSFFSLVVYAFGATLDFLNKRIESMISLYQGFYSWWQHNKEGIQSNLLKGYNFAVQCIVFSVAVTIYTWQLGVKARAFVFQVATDYKLEVDSLKDYDESTNVYLNAFLKVLKDESLNLWYRFSDWTEDQAARIKTKDVSSDTVVNINNKSYVVANSKPSVSFNKPKGFRSTNFTIVQ